MTKYITVKLTEDQYNNVFHAVDYYQKACCEPGQAYAFFERIKSTLAQAKSKVTS